MLNIVLLLVKTPGFREKPVTIDFPEQESCRNFEANEVRRLIVSGSVQSAFFGEGA